MYLEAMKDAGASTDEITQFIKKSVMALPGIKPLPWRKSALCSIILGFTFSIIESGQAHKVRPTFGREDLIPQMFGAIIMSIQRQFPEENLSRFHYYFQRHIELDDDTHGPLALKMIEQLCGNDTTKWEEVTQTALEALGFRKKLWDGVLAEINETKSAEIA